MVYVPEDATGKVSVNVDGKNYTADIINGTAVVVLKDLVLGENNVTVTYLGDSKYPKTEIKEVLNITYYEIIDEYDQQGQLEYISILLPNDADGNLTLYTVKYIPDEVVIILIKMNSSGQSNWKTVPQNSLFPILNLELII